MEEDRDIYEIATELQEKYNRSYPENFTTWSKSSLDQFDAEEVGTKVVLEERRKCYEEQLKTSYKEYANTIRNFQKETLQQFKEELARKFFVGQIIKVSTTVTDRVFDRAYDRGHSCGFRDIVTEYSELSEFALCILFDYNQDLKFWHL